jgi:hypothetical protein
VWCGVPLISGILNDGPFVELTITLESLNLVGLGNVEPLHFLKAHNHVLSRKLTLPITNGSIKHMIMIVPSIGHVFLV